MNGNNIFRVYFCQHPLATTTHKKTISKTVQIRSSPNAIHAKHMVHNVHLLLLCCVVCTIATKTAKISVLSTDPLLRIRWNSVIAVVLRRRHSSNTMYHQPPKKNRCRCTRCLYKQIWDVYSSYKPSAGEKWDGPISQFKNNWRNFKWFAMAKNEGRMKALMMVHVVRHDYLTASPARISPGTKYHVIWLHMESQHHFYLLSNTHTYTNGNENFSENSKYSVIYSNNKTIPMCIRMEITEWATTQNKIKIKEKLRNDNENHSMCWDA